MQLQRGVLKEQAGRGDVLNNTKLRVAFSRKLLFVGKQPATPGDHRNRERGRAQHTRMQINVKLVSFVGSQFWGVRSFAPVIGNMSIIF